MRVYLVSFPIRSHKAAIPAGMTVAKGFPPEVPKSSIG